MFLRIKKWTLATVRTVSYGVKVGDRFPRRYSLNAKSWTEVPDQDAALLDQQHPKELVLSKEATPIKSEKVVYANQPRPKGKDPQNTANYPKPKAGNNVAPEGDPEVPDEDPELAAGQEGDQNP